MKDTNGREIKEGDKIRIVTTGTVQELNPAERAAFSLKEEPGHWELSPNTDTVEILEPEYLTGTLWVDAGNQLWIRLADTALPWLLIESGRTTLSKYPESTPIRPLIPVPIPKV